MLFGGGKLAGIGKALGRSIKDFKNEVRDINDNKKDDKDDSEKTEALNS